MGTSLKGLWTACVGKRFMVLSEAILIAITFCMLILSVGIINLFAGPFTMWLPCDGMDQATRSAIDNMPINNGDTNMPICLPNTMPDSLSSYFAHYIAHYAGVGLGFLALLLHMYTTTATFQYGG